LPAFILLPFVTRTIEPPQVSHTANPARTLRSVAVRVDGALRERMARTRWYNASSTTAGRAKLHHRPHRALLQTSFSPTGCVSTSEGDSHAPQLAGEEHRIAELTESCVGARPWKSRNSSSPSSRCSCRPSATSCGGCEPSQKSFVQSYATRTVRSEGHRRSNRA
jgi:hypothetical protein